MHVLTTSLLLAATVATTLVGSGTAQQQIPIPYQLTTTNGSADAWGFWFEAPASGPAFDITGLRHLKNLDNPGSASLPQYVAVKRFASSPPSGPGTVLFSASNQPGNLIIPCSVTVNPGDVIAVLSDNYYCMFNSCGNFQSLGFGVNFASNAAGTPISLNGCSSPSIRLNGTGGSVTPHAAQVGRIEVYAQPHCSTPATRQTYGTGCLGLTHDASANPVIGTTIQLMTTNLPAGTGFGATVQSLTRIDPGIDLTPMGLTGCFQYVGVTIVGTWVPTGGILGLTPFTIPNDPALFGLPVRTQGAVFKPGINPAGVATSNGLELRVGC